MKKITNLTEAFNSLNKIKESKRIKEDLNPLTIHDYIDDFVSMEDLGLMALKWLSSAELVDMLEANGYEDVSEFEESLTEDLAYILQKLHDEDDNLWNLHGTDYTWLYTELDKYGNIDEEEIADIVRKMPKSKQYELFDKLVEPLHESLKDSSKKKSLKEARKTLGSKNRNHKDTAVDLCVTAMNAIEELFNLNGEGYVDLSDIISSEESQTLNKAIEILDKIGYDIEIRLDEPDAYDESLNEKTSLKEARWSYTLKSGSKLRSAINDEDPMGVIFALQNAYAELRDAGLIDEDDFDSYTSDFELYEEDDDDIEETADYELDNFYDLCDALKVWIPLD